MKCYNCGHDLPEPKEGITIKFCPTCGARVLAAEVAAEATAAVEAAQETTAEVVEAAQETAAEVVAEATEAVQETAVEAVEAAQETAAEVAAEATAAVEAAQETAAEVAAEATEAVQETAAEVAAEATAAVETAAQTAETAVEAAQETAAEAVEAAQETAAETVEAAQETAAETAAEATTAAAAASAIGVPPEVQPAAKKKSKLPLIIALIVVVLGVAGYFIYQNLPSTRVAKFKKQAAELHAAASYEQEIEVLRQAEELAKDDLDLVRSETDAMLAKAKALLDENKQQDAFKWFKDLVSRAEALPEAERGKYYDSISTSIKGLADMALTAKQYETAEALLKQRGEIIPAVTGIAAQTEADLLAVYTKWTEDALNSGDKEKYAAQEAIIDRVLNENLLKGKTAELKTLKERLSMAGMLADLKEIGAGLKKYIDDGKLSLASSQMYLSVVSSLGKGNYISKWIAEDPTHRSPVIADIDGTNKIGLYYDKPNNRLYTYIGQYDANNKRSGNGSWITYMGSALNTQTSYVATGTWSDDKPNGSFTIYDELKNAQDSSQNRTKNITVNTKNGLFEGEAVTEYIKGDSKVIYRPTYTDGHPKVIEDHEQGGTVYHIIAFSEDKKTFMHNTKGAESIEGIYGFF